MESKNKNLFMSRLAEIQPAGASRCGGSGFGPCWSRNRSGAAFGGNDAGAPVEEGKVDGSNVSFKVGTSSYSGTVKEDRIELQRTTAPRFPAPRTTEPSGPQPAIGPPPDGSDPSRNPNMRQPPTVPLVLHRVNR